MTYLEKENLLSKHQFGFRTGLGTADLLTSLNHQWLSCINTGGAVRVLAVDIAGAFDRVSHLGVLHKIRSYGLDGTLHRWLTSYLTDRNLQVVVGGATSQPFPIAAGVPQGSILGPTLFLLYVNDAADVLPDGVSPATYADDTTLYSTMSSMETATATCQTFQTGVNKLAQWGATWRIQFEPSKSQAMTISRHRVDWPIPPVAFNGLNVADVNAKAVRSDLRSPSPLWPTFANHCSSRCTADWLPEEGIQSTGPQRPDCRLQRFRSADA